MSSALVTAAEALKDEINLAPWPKSFTAARSWGQWRDELPDLDVLHVDVLGVEHYKTELQGRKQLKYVVSIDVAVRQRFTSVTNQAVDELVELLERLNEWSIGRRLSTFDEAVWESSDIMQSTSRKLLQTVKQYSGFARIKYAVPRSLR